MILNRTCSRTGTNDQLLVSDGNSREHFPVLVHGVHMHLSENGVSHLECSYSSELQPGLSFLKDARF